MGDGIVFDLRYYFEVVFLPRFVCFEMSFSFSSSGQDGKFAMGFTGDIGDGPTTAYDALPPKPWKADAK